MIKLRGLVLIACECSQVVCKAFRDEGIECYSCDIQKEYGGFPEWHIQDDILNVIPGHCYFKTNDGKLHYVSEWSLIIAHPPCTYLSKAGANHLFSYDLNGNKVTNIDRLIKLYEAANFFYKIIEITPLSTMLCIENPVPLKIAKLPKPDQKIQPYYFGSNKVKYTYYWLYHGLPPLRYFSKSRPKGCISICNCDSRYPGLYNSAKMRSQTDEYIARAMAYQWGALIT